MKRLERKFRVPGRCGRLTALTALGGVILAGMGPQPLGRAAEPAADGAFRFTLRDRVPSPADPGRFEVRERTQRWEPKKTALIICDMWELHHCKRAVERGREMAPRMNDLIARARDRGALIIHAPSGCMAPYKDTPMRRR